MSDPPTIVLVEDDAPFAEELVEFLDAHGIKAIWFDTLTGRLEDIVGLQPDLLVLDQFVAGHDSLTSLAELRRRYHGGVLVLTANTDAVDRIVALETGADDFVAKSLGPRELLARLRAVLRRVRPAPGTAAQAGRWVIDRRRQLLMAPDGTALKLTGAEFAALVFMSENAGRLISRDELSATLFNRPFAPLDRSVDNIISRIRKVIEPYMPGETAIRSVRGRGYIFVGFEIT